MPCSVSDLPFACYISYTEVTSHLLVVCCSFDNTQTQNTQFKYEQAQLYTKFAYSPIHKLVTMSTRIVFIWKQRGTNDRECATTTTTTLLFSPNICWIRLHVWRTVHFVKFVIPLSSQVIFFVSFTWSFFFCWYSLATLLSYAMANV